MKWKWYKDCCHFILSKFLFRDISNDDKREQIFNKTLGRLPGGSDTQGLWEGHVHTEIFKMDNQQRHIVQHMELCSMFMCQPGLEEGLGENEYMYIYG